MTLSLTSIHPVSLLAGAVATAVVAACGGNDESAAASQVVACGGRTYELAAAGAGARSGDVDGDGVSDSVFVARLRGAPAPCRVVVVARVAGRVLAAPIREREAYAPVTASLGLPRVEVLAQLDSTRATEIVVRLWEGASTRNFGVFRVVRARLVRVAIREPASAAGVLTTGGVVTAAFGIDCVDRGSDRFVVESSQSVGLRNASTVTRRFYELRTSSLELVATTRRESRGPVRPAAVTTGRFASCRPRS